MSDAPISKGPVTAPPKFQILASMKSSAEVLDAWVNVAAKIALAAIIICLLFWPRYSPLASRFALKPSTLNILGVNVQFVDLALTNKDLKIGDDGSITIKGHDINSMPDQIDRLTQSVNDLTNQGEISRKIIDNLNKALASSAQELQSLHAQLAKAAPADASGVKAAVDRVISSASALGQDVKDVGVQSANLREIAQSVVSSVNSLSATGFGVVFSGDADVPSALYEIGRAPRDASGTLILYKRQKSWRSVAYYATRQTADADLAKFRKIWPHAYIVNLSIWCPNYTVLVQGDDKSTIEQKDCGF